MSDVPMRVQRCTTHHVACDCREWKFEQLEVENAHFKTRCEYLEGECEKLVVLAKELKKANHTLRGLVDVVLDADEFNGHDVSKADRELRLPKAWITEARKEVGDE